MTIATASPETSGPIWRAELVTITAMNSGSGPSGGGVLLPGSDVQLCPQAGVTGWSEKPLKLRGAGPAVNELCCAHWEPQK
jgi:hypothetical protein